MTDQYLRRQLAKIAKSIVGHDARISVIERTAQAKYVSITDGSTTYYNTDGEPAVITGRQPDGTYTTVDLNGVPLVEPSAPILTTQPGVVVVTWDGLDKFASSNWPPTFSHIEVHMSLEPDFATVDVTELATFHGTRGGTLTLALIEDTYYFKLVAVNTSGAESIASTEVSIQSLPLNIENGIQTYRTDDAPIGLGATDVGALWFDTNDDNRMHYWDGAQWVDIQPTAIDQAVEDALEALDEVKDRAKLSYDNTRPTGLTADDRVLWMDPNNGYAAQYWNGVVWSAYYFGSEAIGFDARDIGGILTASGLTPPSNPVEGDIWYNANENNRPERWDGDSWEVVRDTDIETAVQSYITEYAVNSSETVAPTTGWSTDTPVRTPGTFTWFRASVTRGDGTTSTTNPALLTGNTGATGASAQTIALTATAQILTSPAAGGATNPTTSVVTGTPTNTTITAWDYSVNGAAFSATVPAGVSRTGNVVTITGSTMTARTIAVRMGNGAGASDTLTVAKVLDGATGSTGGTGSTGPAGADAYTVLLTNEAHAFPGSTTTALAGSTTSQVIAYEGSVLQSVTIGAITGQVTGLTTAVTNNSTTTAGFTITVTTALTQQSGELVVPVTVDGVSFTKRFSWSVARAGAAGSQGIQGPAGSDGQSLFTWLKYADTPTTGMADLPAGKTYLGIAYNKTTATESSVYSDYDWSLIQGPQGNTGIQGPAGANGQPTYTWIKYGDSAVGAGLSDTPAGKAYIGIAYNKTTATESSTAGDYEWSLIQGPAGADGAPAAVVELTATTQALVVPAAGGATSPATSTVTGVARNTTITAWQYSVNGAAFSATVPAGVSRSSNVVTITGSTMTASTIAVRMADANGVADTLTVAKVANGATGSTGGTGPAGADAYTVLLTNEAHSFAGSTTAAIAGSTTSQVLAFKGTSQLPATIGTITGQVTGLTTAITSNGTTTAGFTVTVTTSLTAQSGELTVPVTVDGVVFTKKFVWSVGRAGAAGATGSTGPTGVSVTAVTPYFAVVTTGAAAPAQPAIATPAAPWVATEPGYTPNTELYRTEKITFSNATFAYTAVFKSSAYTAAVLAQLTADSKITSFTGATDPAASAEEGDLWLKPEVSEGVNINVLYRRSASNTWVRVSDPAAQQAIADATAAAELADSKMQIHPQDTPPTGLTAVDNGDLWIDTNDSNKTYRYLHGSTAGTNGSGGSGPWISILDGSLASIEYVNQEILISASGKNKAVYSTGVPGATPNTIGDSWFQYNVSNQIIGQWRGAGGTTWTAVTLENTMIATLDAGKITTGFLDVANRIQAGSLAIGKVQNLQTSLDAQALESAKLASKGTDLVINGTGSMGDSTNFDFHFTANKIDVPTGASASFYAKQTYAHAANAEALIPFDPAKKYRFSSRLRQTVTGATTRAYGFVSPFDQFGNNIAPFRYMFKPNTTTTLAAPLNPGDTTITLTSAANWFGSAAKPAGSNSHFRSLIIWNWVDPNGKVWPPHTYTQNPWDADLWADGGISGNVITLRAPWAGPAYPSGHPLSNGDSGGSFVYMPSLINVVIPEVWTSYSEVFSSGVMGEVTAAQGRSAATWGSGLPPGTAQVRVGWLLNYPPSPANPIVGRHAVANVSFSDASAAQTTADEAMSTALDARTGAVSDLKTLWGHPSNTTLIDGGDIFTDSIRARSLLLTDINNYLSDPGFIDNSDNSWALSGGSSVTVSTPGQPGYMTMNASTTGGNHHSGDAAVWATEPGTQYQVSGEYISVAGNTGTITFTPSIQAFNYDGSAAVAFLNGPSAAVSDAGTWLPFSYTIVIPDGAGKFRWYPFVSTTVANNKVRIRGIKIRRKNAGSLIVDGTIESAQLAADSVDTDQLRAGAVTSESIATGTLEAGFVLSNRIGVGQIEITPAGGIIIPQPGGGRIHLPSDGVTPARFDGHANLDSVTVRNYLNILGTFNKISGSVKLSNGVTEPTSPPAVFASWNSVYSSTINGTSYSHRLFSGVAPHTSVASRAVAVGNFFDTFLRQFDAVTGAWNGDIDLTGKGWHVSFFSHGITMAGGNYFIVGQDNVRSKLYVYKINSVGTKLGEIEVGPSAAFSNRTVAIASNGTRVYIIFSDPADNIGRATHWDMNLTAGSVQTASIPDFAGAYNFSGAWAGDADMGSSRIFLLAEEYAKVFVLNPNSGFSIDYTQSFPVAGNRTGRGVWWHATSGRFKTIDRDGFLNTYAPNLSNETITVSNTWYDGVGTTRETREGPVTTFARPARAWITIETGVPPDSGNTDPSQVDKANRTAVYVGVGAGVRRLQGGAPLGVDGNGVSIRTLQIDSIALGTQQNPNSAGATNTFIGSAVPNGKIVSGAESGGQPLLEISGDGSVKANTAAVATTLTVGAKPIVSGAAGSVFVGSPTSSVNVSFPASRFAAAPVVTATCTVGGNVALIANVGSITTTGCIVYLYGVGGTWSSGAISVMWTASPVY